ncbi:MAG: hypothetical protein WDK96_03270 [Candidatus Paceibacterota bacterium]|jgi:hypothetical protein
MGNIIINAQNQGLFRGLSPEDLEKFAQRTGICLLRVKIILGIDKFKTKNLEEAKSRYLQNDFDKDLFFEWRHYFEKKVSEAKSFENLIGISKDCPVGSPEHERYGELFYFLLEETLKKKIETAETIAMKNISLWKINSEKNQKLLLSPEYEGVAKEQLLNEIRKIKFELIKNIPKHLENYGEIIFHIFDGDKAIKILRDSLEVVGDYALTILVENKLEEYKKIRQEEIEQGKEGLRQEREFSLLLLRQKSFYTIEENPLFEPERQKTEKNWEYDSLRAIEHENSFNRLVELYSFIPKMSNHFSEPEIILVKKLLEKYNPT